MNFKMILAASLTIIPFVASASPLYLEYTVEAQGAGYAYDFRLSVDNNDGSFTAGDSFDWFIIGDAPFGSASPFSEGASFFTTVPTGWYATSTSGGHNGPTLGFGTSVALPGWTPALGDSIAFSGFSSTFVSGGDLLWSNIQGSGDQASFASATPVPVPAALPLLIAGLGGLGFMARLKRKAA